MNYLFVVAHPDDEVLGAGATIYTLLQEGQGDSGCAGGNRMNLRVMCPADALLIWDMIGLTIGILGLSVLMMF